MITCDACGHELSARLCPECRDHSPANAVFCCHCGRKFPKGDAAVKKADVDPFDPDNRVLCGDGACIGVIDENGLCTECRRPLSESKNIEA
jgi:hypothetical protein